MKKLVLLFVFFSLITTNYSQNIIKTKPYQFIAKLYTEALGRITDESTWNSYATTLKSKSTDDLVKSYLSDLAKGTYKSSEFRNDYDDTTSSGLGWEARVLAAYRGILNREPDASIFNSEGYVTKLKNGTYTWSNVVDYLCNSTEFNNLLTTMVSASNNGMSYYGWGTTPVLTIRSTSNNNKVNFIGTETQLQTLLDGLSVGDSVTLAPMSVVRLTQTLNIKAGVTLSTNGSPSHFKYAKMGRLVRDSNFDGDMVKVHSGSVIKNVWIDGQVGRLNRNKDYVNVKFDDASGSNVNVNNNRLNDPPGWTNIFFNGFIEGSDCSNFQVKNNLITGYATDHLTASADGISVVCEDTQIYGNQIVDITDIPIVIFRSDSTQGTNNQHSSITYNQILNAGNSAYGAISLDGGKNTISDNKVRTFSFYGTTVENNKIWSSEGAHIDLIFWIGTRFFFNDADNVTIKPNRIDGGSGTSQARIQNNSTGTNKVRTNSVFPLDGFINVKISSNNIVVDTLQSYLNMPTQEYLKNTNTFWSSITSNSSPAFTSYTAFDSTYLNEYGHANGMYIYGPNEVYEGQTYTFNAVKLGSQSVNSYWWYIRKKSGSSWIDTMISNNQNSSLQLTIPTNSNNYIWLRCDTNTPNARISNKYLKNRTRLGKINAPIDKTALPSQFELFQNYPNPFNPVTIIKYSIASKGLVNLTVYDILGRNVSTLVNTVQVAGVYEIEFDGSKLPSGVYIYKLMTNAFNSVKKLVLLK